MKLYNYVVALADKVQKSWNLSQMLFYRNLSQTAPCEDTRANCRKVLYYISEGLHDFRQNYRVDEKDGVYRILYDETTSGMPKIHCVVNAKTGEVASQTTELVNEPHFSYNLMDPRSREACLAIADYTGDYLK